MTAIDTPLQTAWGPFRDPDMNQTIEAYGAHGIEFMGPEDIRGLTPDEKARFAEQCADLLAGVYGFEEGKPRYPLSTGEAAALHESIDKRVTHMFALMTDGHLRSMAAIVEQPNNFATDVRTAELGRAAESPENHVSSRGLLKARVPWAMDNLMSVDYLVSTTRSSAKWADDLPSGKGIQSVWWGSRKFGSQIPFITTEAGYDYVIGRPESFTGFVIPTDPDTWSRATREHPTFVGSSANAAMLSAFVTEGTQGRVHPNTLVAEGLDAGDIPFKTLKKPSELSAGHYAVTENPVVDNPRDLDLSGVNADMGDTPSQKIVIEADYATTPRGSAVIRDLEAQGWTMVGWRPSLQEYGVMCPVMSRINPARVSEVVAPEHHAKYYDEAGMPQTRAHLDAAYNDMRRQAA